MTDTGKSNNDGTLNRPKTGEEHQLGVEAFLTQDENDYTKVQTVKEGQSIFDYLKISFLNTEERQEQFSVLMSSSLQTALFMILEWIPSLVQLYFIGQIDDPEQAGGFGMGLVWSNCFAVGIFGGLGVGVETLAAFAYGADKYKMTGVIFQRGFAIASALMIPIIFLMWMSDDIITHATGKESLGQYASIYCRYGIPAFYLSGIYNIFKGFLTAQNEYSLPLITVSISAFCSIIYNFFFIQVFKWGIMGAALARILTESMNLSIIYYLVNKKKINVRCPIKLTKLAFREWGNFLKFAVPIGSLLTLEWFSYELFTFQASHLTSGEFNAHVIMNNVNTVYYQFGYGVSIAMTTYVGNEMGSKCISKAIDYSKQGMIIIFTFIVATQLPFSLMKDSFVSWFSVNLETQTSLGSVFLLFQLCMTLDACLAGVTGITRGIGKQNFAAGSFVVSYLIIGQIISYILAFVFGWGLQGLWLGVIFGMCVTTSAQIWCAGYSDWKVLLDIIQQNLEKDEQKNRQLMGDEHMDEESNRQALLAAELEKPRELDNVTIEMKTKHKKRRTNKGDGKEDQKEKENDNTKNNEEKGKNNASEGQQQNQQDESSTSLNAKLLQEKNL